MSRLLNYHTEPDEVWVAVLIGKKNLYLTPTPPTPWFLYLFCFLHPDHFVITHPPMEEGLE